MSWRSVPRPRSRVALRMACAVLACAASIVAVLGAVLGSTLREPSFYLDQLEQQRVFERLDEELVPARVDAALREHVPEIEPELARETAELVGETLSQRWFAERTGAVLDALVPWLDGRQGGFEVHITVADLLLSAAEHLSARLPQSALAQRAYDAALARAVDRIEHEGARVLPLGLTVSRETWLQVLATAAPLEWVAAELAHQLTGLVAYLSGESDTLAVRIHLRERRDDLAAAIALLVDQSDFSGFVARHVLGPLLRHHVTPTEVVPDAGIVLATEEITAAFESALTAQWLEERETDVAVALSAYLTGESDTLALEVPLVPLKTFAAQELAATLGARLEGWFDALPACQGGRELGRLLLGGAQALDCRPLDLTFDDAVRYLGIDLEARVRAELDALVPDVWVHDEEAMRGYLSEQDLELVAQARRLIDEGVVVDRAQIEGALAAWGADPVVLDGARAALVHGWTLRDEDVRAALASSGGGEALAALEQLRLDLHRARVLWIPSAVVALLSLLGLFALAPPERRLLGPALGLTLASLGVLLSSAWLRGRVEAFNAQLVESMAAMDAAPSSPSAYLADAAPRVTASMTGEIVSRVQWIGTIGIAIGLVLVALGVLHARRRVAAHQAMANPTSDPLTAR